MSSVHERFLAVLTEFWDKSYIDDDRRVVDVYSSVLKSIKGMMNGYSRVSSHGLNRKLVQKWQRKFPSVEEARKYIEEKDDNIQALEDLVFQKTLQNKKPNIICHRLPSHSGTIGNTTGALCIPTE